MVYTAEQIASFDQLRADVGATEATLSNDQAYALMQQAALLYPTGSPLVLYYAARVGYYRGQVSTYSTAATSYTQNQESESFAAFNNLMKLLAYWERKLADALGVRDVETPPPSGTNRLRATF